MVELERIFFSVPHVGKKVEILKGIDLTLERGEVVALVGPSGCGKSTLLSLVSGVERAVSGQVRVNGYALNGLSEDELARFRLQSLGIVFQDFHLIPTLTALENVALPLELARKPEALAQAAEMLARVGLSHRTDHRPPTLSGGERQRVAIARAFVGKPPLILADEPTGNLDQHTGAEVMALLFDLIAQWGTTFFMVTHDRELSRRAGRILTMGDGVLVGEEGA